MNELRDEIEKLFPDTFFCLNQEHTLFKSKELRIKYSLIIVFDKTPAVSFYGNNPEVIINQVKLLLEAELNTNTTQRAI
jgi:hypothetical protein